MAWIEQRGTRWRVRYRQPDDTVGTDSAHPTHAAAQLRCKQVDVDIATDSYLDPAAGRITLGEWVDVWRETHVAGAAKMAAYDSHLRVHILPAFGHVPLTQINRHAIKVLVKRLKTQLADSTVVSIMSLLGMLMREAVADRRIGYNPCQGLRVASGRRPERPYASTAQINQIAARIDRFADQVLLIAAAYTGMRWGELTGLARTNLDLGTGIIHIDSNVDALHEISGRLFLGPPKTADSVRDIHLPTFLTYLLADVVDSHRHEQVFTGVRGGYLRRSNFTQRVWTPASGGDPSTGVASVIAGMHFHDLRYFHKTWLTEDDIPEIAQAKRLGHRMPGVRGIYSHVTPAMQQRITIALQARWETHQSDNIIRVRRRLRAA